ncbi:Oxidoreductase, molybdopterin-binding domain-containing protein [Rhodotorula toruloides]|uniref:Oxidoreductase, molybdopterin-binding domain-containing protein n=2 Tax=Rhodotorula toruloides TaxID=5286 RepID=A0A2T0A485_RHOTO|nr:Oxidoreductase, molybdopterin-binding domain-containing protein [Rhodotorula toruloides]PRQ72834.1 Oxidoreductase, molybdopterin-binding domain-containing protein [Rhodotorula toruloides]
MAQTGHRVLSEHPLNSEPPTASLVSSFLTPTSSIYSRNHGEIRSLPDDYALSISSEVVGVSTTVSSIPLADLKALPKQDVVTVLACAGNRRIEMDEEKEVEGLKWGGSAIANCHFAGTLLRDLLSKAGVTLDDLRAKGLAGKLHIHFESDQECQDDKIYAASLPLEMALNPERPTLLAYEMNHSPLTKPHGAPLRLVVPGIIGARSVKWLERIIIRDHESDNFYQKRDYKVLPPEATPKTKADFLKQTPALMEFPLNSEICEPEEHAVVDVSLPESTVTVKGYAIGAHGVPIASVHVALIPLPISDSTGAATTTPVSVPEIASSELCKIRLAASNLPSSAWTPASLDAGPTSSASSSSSVKHTKHWAWTLFSATLPVPDSLLKLAELGVGGSGTQVAAVSYAVDVEGKKQELQTEWNLRGVAEASWSVRRFRVRKAVS